MRRAVAVLVAVMGCSDSGGDVPAPWTSGTRIRAQVYTDSAGDVVGLAGRLDTQLSWSCPVDDANTPAFAQCPPAAWLYYRAFDCSIRDVVRGRDTENVVTKFAVAPVDGADHYFQTTQPTTEPITDRDAMGTCTVPATGADEFLVTEIDASALDLGTVVDHGSYASLDTSDGFRVVMSVDGGQPTTGPATGRIRPMYTTAHGVSAFAGMLDTTTGQRCVPIATDSGRRCLPPLVPTYGGPLVWASDAPSCGGPFAWVARQPIFATVKRDALEVVQCGAAAAGPVYESVPLVEGGCRQVTGAYACTEMPVTSFEALTLTAE